MPDTALELSVELTAEVSTAVGLVLPLAAGVALASLAAARRLRMCKAAPAEAPVEFISSAATDARRTAVGMVMIMASGVLFAFMSALTRMVSDAGMPSMQIVLVSGVVRWIGLASILVCERKSPFGPRKARGILVLRSLCGGTALSCATYGFGVMPIGDATTIFLTSPVWAALLGRAVLGEKLHLFDALAIFLAIIGVVLVARPTALFGVDVSESGSGSGSEIGTGGGFPGWIVCAAGAGFAGSVAVLVRLLKARGVKDPSVIAHAYAIITVTVAPIALYLLPGQSFTFTRLDDPGRTWLLALGIGVLAIPNQLLVNAGLLRTPAALGSMMRLIDVPSAFVLQVLFFTEMPHASSVGGAGLIVLCTVGSAWRKWRAGRQGTTTVSATRPRSFGSSFGRLEEEQVELEEQRPPPVRVPDH